MGLSDIEKAAFSGDPTFHERLRLALHRLAKKVVAEDVGYPPVDQKHAVAQTDLDWAASILQGLQLPAIKLLVSSGLDDTTVGENPLSSTDAQTREALNDVWASLRKSVLGE